jgi:hypothetical protein
VITLRKFAYAILIIIITVGALLLLEDAHADTYVNGTIDVNTTWTSANSPYTLTGDVFISNGVTLTVQPGVTVNFGSYKIYVNGILNAQGTIGNYIVFSGNGYSSIVFTSTSTDWSGTSGCTIDNAYISSLSLAIEDSSPKISNNYFSSIYGILITVSGGSPLISNNVFVFDSSNCIHINSGSSPVISYNVIAGEGQYYGIYTEGPAYISYNNITGCWTGIYAVGASAIQYNNIMGNDNDGIRSENNASIIQNNVLANNNVGVTGTGVLRDNTIANNGVAGIWGPLSSASISRNNIYDNTQNVHLTQPDNITALDNWWGTTDASAINQTIWDHKNASNLGTLNFIPYLTEPNPSAPSIPTIIIIPPPPTTPTPTPSPSPTPTPSVTPTPSPAVTPTPRSTITPSPTAAPTETPQESPGQFNITDISSIVIIVVAILLALIIIVFINRKYGKSQSETNADNVN